MKHGFKKKLIMLCTVIAMTISLTGCGASLKDFIANDLSTLMTSRFVENQDIINKLYNNGLISKSTHKMMTSNIEEQSKRYQSDEEISKTLAKSIELIRPLGLIERYDGKTYGSEVHELEIKDDDGKTASKGGKDLEPYVLSDHLYYNYEEWKEEAYGGEWKSRTSGKTEPVKIVDIDALGGSVFDDALDCEVWVLKSDILTADSSGGIDGVIEAVKSSLDDGGRIQSIANISQYFEPAVYSEAFGDKAEAGEKVMLSDLVDLQNLVGISSPNIDPNNNMPGQDLVVQQYGEPILSVKIQEFNRNEIERFMSAMGIDVNSGESTDKWVYYIAGRSDSNIAGTNKVFLMEYPVYYIAGIQDHKDNSNLSELVLAESDLSVNILTGKMLAKKTTVNGTEVKVLITNDNDEPYLTMNGASNFNADSQSAFVVCGTAEINIAEDFDTDADCTMKTGRVILRDYLEGTYAPGFNEEKIVVFGRKIRFTNLMTEKVNYVSPTQTLEDSADASPNLTNKVIIVDKSKHCAVFVDKNGAVLNDGNTPKLYVNNFCSVESLTAAEPSIKRPTASGEMVSEGQGREREVDQDETSNNLDWESTGSYIDISVAFPSEIVGRVDYINDGKIINFSETVDGQIIHQTFYVLATTDDVFSSALFSTWVNNSDKEASLGWWNKWLSDNKYLYKMDMTNVEDYLACNFKFELSQNGILILDLETVAKIQEEFDKDANAQANKTVRTVSRLLGVFLMFYSVVLGLVYVADVTADLGIRFLEKLTFGQWVAVKYDTDVPTHDQESRQYLTFGRMASRLIVLIGVGALLASVDILNLVIILIDTFGGIANKIGEILTGIV